MATLMGVVNKLSGNKLFQTEDYLAAGLIVSFVILGFKSRTI